MNDKWKVMQRKFREALQDREAVRNVLVNSALALVGTVLTDTLFRFAPKVYRLLTRLIGPHFTQVIIGMVVIGMGFVAHWFKRKDQYSYGIVEVVFGGVSGFLIAMTMTPDRCADSMGYACWQLVCRGSGTEQYARCEAEAQYLMSRVPGLEKASGPFPSVDQGLDFLFQGVITRARLSQKRAAVFLRQMQRCLK